MSEYKIYLENIIEAIKRIEGSTKYIPAEKLKENVDLWAATLMRHQVIVESVKKVPSIIKRKYKEIEWKKLAQLRNIISHDYFIVNPLIVEDIIRNKLSLFKGKIKNILKNEK